MGGRLITIEATDGSGKATQARRLAERLEQEGHPVVRVEFPNYASESSALARMYLNGEFGTDPNSVSPYVASTFYAVDRYATFKKQLEAPYRQGALIIADRYTTSNMVHQAGKIEDEAARVKFLDWLWDFEFNMFGLPVPDCVVFLDMPPEFSTRLIRGRVSEGRLPDIHEDNALHIARSYQNACWMADRYNWRRVRCVDGERLRSIDEIHADVYETVRGVIGS